MKTSIELNEFNEEVLVTESDSGHITKELKMTPAQMAIINAPKPPPPDPLAAILTKLEKMETDIADIKAKQK